MPIPAFRIAVKLLKIAMIEIYISIQLRQACAAKVTLGHEGYRTTLVLPVSEFFEGNIFIAP